MGKYFTDPQNTNEYDGHDLLHLRIQAAISQRLSLSARVTNLTDTDYAERADFAFGNERYFVGEPCSLYVGVEYRL